MSWLEVESKIKLKENEVSSIRNRIKRIAKFSKKEVKNDQYFSLEKAFYPKRAFRIRSNGRENIVNFKKWRKKFWMHNVVVKEEFEFRIDNKENFLALMKDLGFKEWIAKTKISETYIHRKHKKLNIELNKVENLGWFIEIEYLAKKSEFEKAKRLVIQTIKSLRTKNNQIDNTGYTKMLWKKKYKN